METDKPLPSCAGCDVESSQRICRTENGKAHKGCPTLTLPQVLADANAEYQAPDIREFARQASIQEAECYAHRKAQGYVLQPTKPRIIEIVEFAQKMGYQRLGLAFCAGLASEARKVAQVFEAYGFTLVSVMCKAGRTPKSRIDLTADQTIRLDENESMCNPVFQAEVLNARHCQFNILLGLCVGHDSLFFRYSKAPVTVLAVKDRVTGHNPLAPIYLMGSYYQKILP